ncbi:hypothetical protein pclt_cds_866 [Pandoravirus celtis]|uniref:Uncharacterized protein n=1 Tax=Pandoravirus celtis TaxID=2568002 RepID=A0A4D6EJH2_9VIRU|nr:hypothetical protein pclt_cds_866 [Pandoravirus celtis]
MDWVPRLGDALRDDNGRDWLVWHSTNTKLCLMGFVDGSRHKFRALPTNVKMFHPRYVSSNYDKLQGPFGRRERAFVKGEVKRLIERPTDRYGLHPSPSHDRTGFAYARTRSRRGSVWFLPVQYADGTWSTEQQNLKHDRDTGMRPIMLLSDEEDGEALFVPITTTPPNAARHLLPVPTTTPAALKGSADCMDLVSRDIPPITHRMYQMPADYVDQVVARVVRTFQL